MPPPPPPISIYKYSGLYCTHPQVIYHFYHIWYRLCRLIHSWRSGGQIYYILLSEKFVISWGWWYHHISRYWVKYPRGSEKFHPLTSHTNSYPPRSPTRKFDSIYTNIYSSTGQAWCDMVWDSKGGGSHTLRWYTLYTVSLEDFVFKT